MHAQELCTGTDRRTTNEAFKLWRGESPWGSQATAAGVNSEENPFNQGESVLCLRAALTI